MDIDQKMFELRDRAMIRIIELTDKRITLQNRLNEARSEKKIQEYSDELDYVSNSIKQNQDIVFHVADMDKPFQLEQ